MSASLQSSWRYWLVVVFISTTSGHFEWASTSTKNILPLNGLAKSTYIRCHGRNGHTHGWSGATAGILLVILQEAQSRAIISSD